MNNNSRKILTLGLLASSFLLPSSLLAQRAPQAFITSLVRRGATVDREVTRTDTGRIALITLTLPNGNTASIENSISRTDTTLTRSTEVTLPNGNTVSSSTSVTRNPDQTVTVTTTVTGPKGNTRTNTVTRQFPAPKD